ncbi:MULTISPECIES: hypothetical protein [unclassified Streptomyces]|uniref:hypothetical protein n=1 Tax=unclassified Streptomyces TaxID=2593676 RepID=UPI00202413F8|nr:MULTISPECIES: hypothetical protein [unclassified Streptomyces]MCX4550574.1 hypothetical protein [Streptomyces sp. NBC_01500]WSC22021.1 hypothetical protein OIE60_21335 [Streptomyces sp. NBC_01766]
MTNQANTNTNTNNTTNEEYVYNPVPPEFVSDQVCEISGRDMGYLIPWMRAQLTTQDRHDDNSDVCQALTSILLQAHRLYGTESGTRETCICRG